jgi:hypothetical protein
MVSRNVDDRHTQTFKIVSGPGYASHTCSDVTGKDHGVTFCFGRVKGTAFEV